MIKPMSCIDKIEANTALEETRTLIKFNGKVLRISKPSSK